MIKAVTTFVLSLTMALNAFAEGFETGSGDKVALLMVHFGTTFDDTRSLTIDAINRRATEAFPEMEVFEAYTSRIIIRKLAKQGIKKHSPREMLLKLASDGYTHVFIQSTNIIEGIEAQALSAEAELMVPFFKEIRVGVPLLYSVDDCERVAAILAARHASAITSPESAVVMVGHGTHTPATAVYSQIEYMFAVEGHRQFHVATIEGYPTFDTLLDRLRSDEAKSVTLIPFMFVAGDHARNDIADTWCNALKKEGFKVDTRLEGLGQIPEIQEIYIDHIRRGLHSRPLSAIEHKASFLNENLK